MISWAKPGVKCVCIDASPYESPGHPPLFGWPIERRVYTVKAVGQFHPHYDGVMLQIAELANPALIDGRDCGWDIRRFRPLITRTQEDDVALFRHHLAGAGVDA